MNYITNCGVCGFPFDSYHTHEACVFKLKQEVDRLKQELTALRDQWIPVSERLPEVKKDTLFLCAFKDFQDKWKVDTRTFWVDSKYFSGSCKIEFYMPLPTPPTEG